jgi:hypothetical protein
MPYFQFALRICRRDLWQAATRIIAVHYFINLLQKHSGSAEL